MSSGNNVSGKSGGAGGYKSGGKSRTTKPGPQPPGPSPEGSQPKALARDLRTKQGDYVPAMEFNPVVPFGNAENEIYKPLPAEYASGPRDDREAFVFKRQLMNDPGLNNAEGKARVNYTIDNNDVKVIKDLDEQRKLYEYHRWIDHHIDPRKPGNLNWLMEVEPDYIKMKMKALNTKMRLLEKRIRLEAFGVQDTEDMRMKFLIDNNMLQDGRAATNANRYVHGFFGPTYQKPGRPSNFTRMLRDATSFGAPARLYDRPSTEPNILGMGQNRGYTRANNFEEWGQQL